MESTKNIEDELRAQILTVRARAGEFAVCYLRHEDDGLKDVADEMKSAAKMMLRDITEAYAILSHNKTEHAMTVMLETLRGHESHFGSPWNLVIYPFLPVALT